MDTRKAILDTPRALREMLEKRRPEYEALIRRTRWGEGPLFIVGRGSSLSAAMTAGLGFESLVGWPVVVREPADFSAYAVGTLRPRSLVLAISASGETAETLEAARAARSRGATLLAATGAAQSTLASLADGVFPVGEGGEGGGARERPVCRHAALGFLTLVTAQALKRHHPQLDALENEFRKLPEQVEWVLTQLGDAVRPFAAALRESTSLTVLGGGFFHAIAAGWTRQFAKAVHVPAECVAATEVDLDGLRGAAAGRALVLVSNSRCRVKKAVNKAAAWAERAGIKALSVTDREDRELQNHSALAILLPGLHEMTGAVLAMALLDWVGYRAAEELAPGPRPARARVAPQ